MRASSASIEAAVRKRPEHVSERSCCIRRSKALKASITTRLDVAPRLGQLGLHSVGQLQFVLAEILQPGAQLGDFLRRELKHRRLYFLQRAHALTLVARWQ